MIYSIIIICCENSCGIENAECHRPLDYVNGKLGNCNSAYEQPCCCYYCDV